MHLPPSCWKVEVRVGALAATLDLEGQDYTQKTGDQRAPGAYPTSLGYFYTSEKINLCLV